MKTLMQRISCSFKTNYKTFYASLSKEELIKRKASLKNQYIIPLLTWIVSLAIMAYAKIETELLILYAGTVISICVMLWGDYTNRLKEINNLLNKKP